MYIRGSGAVKRKSLAFRVRNGTVKTLLSFATGRQARRHELPRVPCVPPFASAARVLALLAPILPCCVPASSYPLAGRWGHDTVRWYRDAGSATRSIPAAYGFGALAC